MNSTQPGVTHIAVDFDITEDFEVRDEALQQLEERITAAPVATTEALKSFVPSADEHQQRVIAAAESTIRLVAPAGSGKTQTLINRALRRIRDGLAPNRVLILTFDNAAASALRDKLQQHLAQLSATIDGARISTLNAFGYSILREYAREECKPIAQPPRPRRIFRDIRDAFAQQQPEHIAALPNNLEDRVYLEFFSVLKNEMFDPRNVKPQAFADFMLSSRAAEPFFTPNRDANIVRKIIQTMSALFKGYEAALQREGLIDFDDQKLRAYVTLQDNEGLRASIQAQFSEIIVDEFQDINKLDFELIKMVAAKSSLVVTGDDDQAIYAFRGCTPDFIIDLEHHLGRPIASYELAINYRCPPNIVKMADQLIRHNNRRIPKNPVAASTTASDVKVVASQTAGVESKLVLTWIRKVLGAGEGLRHNDIAVLYRTNAQSLPIQIDFILNDIPYWVRKEDNILENEILERMLGALRVKLALQARRDVAVADAVLAVQAYFRFVDARAVRALPAYFRTQTSFQDALGTQQFFQILPKARESHIREAIMDLAAARSLLDSLDVLGKRFNGLRGMIANLEDAMNDRAPLAEIYDVATGFRGTISEFVRTLQRALDRARSTDAGKNEHGGVALRTYFRAKGLQWHTVILTSCNDRIIPHRRAPIEDERRLFYVAMTRAARNLVVSYVKQSCNTKVHPSPFLKEAGLLG